MGATSPLGSLGWRDATLVYAVLLATGTSLLAAAAGWAVTRRLGGGKSSPVPAWVLAAGMVTWVWVWRPTSIGQGLGNVGAFAALAACLVLVVRDWRWASVALALAWVKPQFGIPLVIVLLVRRQWRPAVAGTALAAVLSLPMLVKLSRISGGFPALVDTVFSALTWVGERTGGESFLGRADVAGLLEALGLGIGSLLPMALGTVLVGLAGRTSVGLDRRGRPAVGMLLVAAAVTAGFPHLHYDLPILAPLVPWCLLEAYQRRALRVRDPGVLAAGLLLPVGLLSDRLLPEAFPVSRLGGIVCLVLVAGLLVAARVWDPREASLPPLEELDRSPRERDTVRTGDTPGPPGPSTMVRRDHPRTGWSAGVREIDAPRGKTGPRTGMQE